MKIMRRTMLIFTLTVAATACQELDSSSLNGYRATYPANKAADRLQGSWSTACSGGNPSTKTTLLFFNRQISVVTLQFDDSICAKQKYVLTIGKDFTLPSDQNATTQPLSTTARLGQMGVSSGYASVANTASLCGLTNWQETTSVDVTGQTCLTIPVPALRTTASETVVFASDTTITYTGTSLSNVTFTKNP